MRSRSGDQELRDARVAVALRRHRANIVIVAGAALLAALCAGSLMLGRYPIEPGQAVAMLVDRVVPLAQTWTDQQAALFFNVRLPRILLAALVGCGLSAAGAAYQGTFQNPLVSSDILGASQGAALGAAECVAVSGMIGWVGLVIPHLTRMVVGCDYRKLLPASMLYGASFLLVLDNISRLAYTAEIPIGILTAFVGAPLFLYLILRKKRGL